MVGTEGNLESRGKSEGVVQRDDSRSIEGENSCVMGMVGIGGEVVREVVELRGESGTRVEIE